MIAARMSEFCVRAGYRPGKITRQFREFLAKTAASPDQDDVMASGRSRGHYLSNRRSQAALQAIADDGIADLLRHCVADADHIVPVLPWMKK
jgi:hypothetical protein|tara:strand:- start:6721 stop:6996 length:276 start_codon:yes stop_codon:yes gene_type:complete